MYIFTYRMTLLKTVIFFLLFSLDVIAALVCSIFPKKKKNQKSLALKRSNIAIKHKTEGVHLFLSNIERKKSTKFLIHYQILILQAFCSWLCTLHLPMLNFNILIWIKTIKILAKTNMDRWWFLSNWLLSLSNSVKDFIKLWLFVCFFFSMRRLSNGVLLNWILFYFKAKHFI